MRDQASRAYRAFVQAGFAGADEERLRMLAIFLDGVMVDAVACGEPADAAFIERAVKHILEGGSSAC